MPEPKRIVLSHEDCLVILNNPSTQNILEKLGYEYSDRGQADYCKEHLNIVPALVQAIVVELERHPVFPTQYQDSLPQVGVYIFKRGTDFVLRNIEKPSDWNEYAFPTPEGAAHGYVRMILEPYWLKSDEYRSGR